MNGEDMAYADGWDAFLQGAAFAENPYSGTTGESSWEQGFADAREQEYMERKGITK